MLNIIESGIKTIRSFINEIFILSPHPLTPSPTRKKGIPSLIGEG